MTSSIKLTKESILDTIQIAQYISSSDANGKNLNWHPTENKPKYVPIRSQIELFKKKYENTPNVILRKYLDEYLQSKNLAQYFTSSGKPFYSQIVNSYTWACISHKVEKGHLKYKTQAKTSQCPQLYVLINEYGIEFGFGYGLHVDDSAIEIQSIKSHTKFLLKIYEMLNGIDNFKLYYEDEITGKKELIKVQSTDDIKEKWSKSSRLLVIFEKNSIPSNFNEIIYRTFDRLLNLFVYSSLIYEGNPEKIIESLENINELIAESSVNTITMQKNHQEWLDKVTLTKTPPPEKKQKSSLDKSPSNIRKISWIDKQQRNEDIGKAGEEVVFKHERQEVKKFGDENLLKMVKHVSIDDDTLGYDILSVTKDGMEKYIEVKTTSGKDDPFFISDNEVVFSKEHAAQYSLYRVYGYRPKEYNLRYFEIEGDITKSCSLKPVQYQCVLND
ncbi:DUF3883 domain-containing protein [Methanoregula sp.]